MSERFSAPVAAVLARIEEFTEEELHHLNRLIVERLRLMQQVRAHRTMTQFRVGQRVRFHSKTGECITGILTKYNRKSVTVVTDQGSTWTVAPSLLQSAN